MNRLWRIGLTVLGIWSVGLSLPLLVKGIGGEPWMWLILATSIIVGTTFVKRFMDDLMQPSAYACFYCWLVGVAGPWVLFALSAVLSFTGAANLQAQGAVLVLVALVSMVGRMVLVCWTKGV